MIDAAIEYVVAELNIYLNLRSPSLSPDRVVAASLFDLASSTWMETSTTTPRKR